MSKFIKGGGFLWGRGAERDGFIAEKGHKTLMSTQETSSKPVAWRRNYWLNAWEGSAYMAGLAFVSADTVLPRVVELLDGPVWVIGLVPTLAMIGYMLPALFMAVYVSRWQRLFPYLKIMGLIQRLPFLVAALFLWWTPTGTPGLWMVVVGAPLLTGLVGGLCGAAWMEFVTRSIPAERRGSGWGWRSLISSLMSLPAGVVVAWVMANVPGQDGYALLYGIAFLFFAISYFLFVQMREPDGEVPIPEPTNLPLWKRLQEALGLLREDKNLRSYFVSRLFALGFMVLTPFFAISALRATGESDSFLGALLMANLVGMSVGNIAAGWLCDRQGGKQVIQWCQIGLIVSSLVLVILPNQPETWFWLGMTAIRSGILGAMMIGSLTFNAEIAPALHRPAWFGLVQTAQAPAVLLFGIMSGQIELWFGSIAVAAGFVVVTQVVAFLGLRNVQEPRMARSR